jgi:histone-lysine N-methyltransferase SETMAR
VLLPDNAHSHTAAHTVVTLKKLNFEVLEHPSYSPVLAASDYHLFDSIQQALGGRQFTAEQQLKEMVHVWSVSQPKAFYSESI